MRRLPNGGPITAGVDGCPRRRTADGATLVEVLVALFLVTILVAALVRGLLVSTTATATANRAQRIDAALTSFGESIKQLNYQECADPAWYQQDFDALTQIDPGKYGVGTVADALIESVEYWNDGSFAAGQTPSPGAFSTQCDDGGSQLVTYRVSLGERTARAQVVKRSGYGQSGGPVAVTTTTTIDPGNEAPKASFTANPAAGAAPLGVYLDASSSTDDGLVVNYRWDFRDGSAPLTTTDPGISRQFPAGMFLVQLTVTDDEGATSTTYRTVSATGVPAAPTGLRKTGSPVDLSGVYFELAWDPVAGVQEYQIQLTGTAPFGICGTRSVSVSAPASTGRIKASTLCATGVFGIQYNATIRARVGTQWSPWSVPLGVTL